MDTPLKYYAGHGPMTAGADSAELRALPRDLAALCKVVQGTLIHRDMAPFAYDLKLSEEQRDDAHTRPLPAMLKRIRQLSAPPLSVVRDTSHRMPSVCRHFSLMLCGILREQGVPARLRCGFGSYFNAGKFEDHWVCEYWNAAERRWILVDVQLDDVQSKLFKLDFDPLDVPHDRFIIAGDAWRMYRSGRGNPESFGLSPANLKGMWFIAGNVVRDLAALNRVEMLPWDVWGLMSMDDASFSEESKQLLDTVAALTVAGDEAFPEIRRIYDTDARLRVPGTVFNALRNASEAVAI